MKNILILGAGFGGLTAANMLAKHPDCNVTLIDRNSNYYMGSSKLWVAVGKRSPEECQKPYSALKKKSINFIQTEITNVDLEKKIVETPMQGFSYDYLIIAMGADLEPDKLPGFDHAYNLYSMQGVQEINKSLRRMKRGKLVILVSSTPFKCPAAPYEAAFIIEGYLRQLQTRNDIEISIYTPEPQPMPVAGQAVGEKIQSLLKNKGISFFPNHKPAKIEKNSLLFESGTIEYDLLLAVPSHSLPRSLDSLANQSGWIPVDKNTLETKFANVFAIGDCSAIQLANGKFLPKAGVLAEEEAKVVAHNILADITQNKERVSFNGKGYCFVETGDGKAAYADGDFFAEPLPNVVMQEPSEEFLQGKIEFEKKRMKEWF